MGHQYQTVIKKPVLEGTTPRITFQIVDEDGDGFQPATLTMSIYDVTEPVNALPSTTPLFPPNPTLAESIVNSRNDVDIFDKCDTDGNVDLVLESGDTDVDVPAGPIPAFLQRRILFTWTWDSDPVRVGKHEVLLTIAPDRETEAS